MLLGGLLHYREIRGKFNLSSSFSLAAAGGILRIRGGAVATGTRTNPSVTRADWLAP